MAVSAGGAALVAVIAFDAAVNLLTRGAAARGMAQVQVAEMAVVLAAAFAARRSMLPAEPLAMLVLCVAYVLAFVGFVLDPASEMLTTAELAILIVGSGLFLPWSSRWHAAWLALAGGIATAFATLPVELSISVPNRLAVLPVVTIAAVTSLIGQSLWHGRLRRMLEQQFELRRLSRFTLRQQAHVRQLNRELRHAARTDPLTGVGNRLALDEALARLLDQGERTRPMRFSLILLDLDHFKRFNDRHGHLAGDAALSRVGAILRRVMRGNDYVFRFGGEEFLVLLPELPLAETIAVAERVRVAVEQDRAPGEPNLTISGGVALCDPADGRDPGPLLRRADKALYLAKRGGRNRIAVDELSSALQRQEVVVA